jgi:hypothetical protein
VLNAAARARTIAKRTGYVIRLEDDRTLVLLAFE